MARTRKTDKPRSKSKSFAIFDDEEQPVEDGEEELPKDEAGRRKIKRQYEELLGIRIEKLKGRILNRERINKTIEGVFFICASCKKVCHNLDEGLVEDDDEIEIRAVISGGSEGGRADREVRAPGRPSEHRASDSIDAARTGADRGFAPANPLPT